jgi:hypothetical protein
VASLPTQNQMNGIVTITWMQFFPPSIIPFKHMYTCEIYLNHSVSHWNPFNHLSVVLVRFNNNRGMVGFISIFCLWKSVYNQSHSVTSTCLSLKSPVSLDKSNGVDAIIYSQTLKYHISILYQWIGLRENLQETMVFTIKYRGFLLTFSHHPVLWL